MVKQRQFYGAIDYRQADVMIYTSLKQKQSNFSFRLPLQAEGVTSI